MLTPGWLLMRPLGTVTVRMMNLLCKVFLHISNMLAVYRIVDLWILVHDKLILNIHYQSHYIMALQINTNPIIFFPQQHINVNIKTNLSMFCITGFLWGNPPVTARLPSQRTSYAGNASGSGWLLYSAKGLQYVDYIHYLSPYHLVQIYSLWWSPWCWYIFLACLLLSAVWQLLFILRQRWNYITLSGDTGLSSPPLYCGSSALS